MICFGKVCITGPASDAGPFLAGPVTVDCIIAEPIGPAQICLFRREDADNTVYPRGSPPRKTRIRFYCLFETNHLEFRYRPAFVAFEIDSALQRISLFIKCR